MKSQLLVIILICFSGLMDKPVKAQQIVNGGFEEVYLDTVLFPDIVVWKSFYWSFGWTTNLNCYPILGEMTNDSHTGDWAVKLETVSCNYPIVSGIIANDSEMGDSIPFPGFPAQNINARPDQIAFHHKYIPVNGDTATFGAVVFNFPDSITMWNPYWFTYIDTVGVAQGVITETNEDYTQYVANFEYTTSEIPQYFSVYFSSNHNGVEFYEANPPAHVGTTLWVDDVELIYLNTSSQNLLQEVDVQIYPNPIADHFQVEVPTNIAVLSMQVHDFLGRRVKTLNPQNRFHSLTELPTGMYFLTLHTDHGSVVKKLVKE